MPLRHAVDGWLRSRFDPQATAGFYESYFQRANHPSRPLAFWIRYTVFVPRGQPQAAAGELWAIYFDGESGRSTVVYEAHPIAGCSFSRTGFDVRVGEASLGPGVLQGSAAQAGHRIGWSLSYEGGGPALCLLQAQAYEASFPAAKSVVPSPGCRYRGRLEVDSETIDIDGWLGSQNHNWGLRHTDQYVWGQVAGFDGADDAFLECFSARLRLGPVWSPYLSLLVLRVGSEQYTHNALGRAVLAHARVNRADGFDWSLVSQRDGVRIAVRVHAPAAAFVRLRYRNPPGGEKICMNTKLANATLSLKRPGQPELQLRCAQRAAFELVNDPEHTDRA